MARRRFGADLTGVVWRIVSVSGIDNILQLAPGQSGITAWTAQSGGAQVTDLTTSAGVALPGGVITADALGLLDFFGPTTTPDTVTLWLDIGAGTRQQITASDLAAQVLGSVPQTRVIASGTGLTGGGDLTADRTLSVVPNTTNQRVEVSRANIPAGVRPEINFVEGANVTIGVADNPGADRVDVTIGSTGGGGGGSGYATAADEGTALTPRTILNFQGAGVVATDDPVNGRTNVVVTGTATVLPRPACLIVAGADAPAAVKAGADYVCDGSTGGNNDQVELNAALLAAFRQSAGTWGQVMVIGNLRINAPVIMRSANVLAGVGPGAIIKSVGMSADVGMVELFDKNQHMCTVRDLTLDGNGGAGGGSWGVRYVNSDGGGDGFMGTNEPGNSPDASHRFSDVFIKNFGGGTRHGLYLGDNCRETQGSRIRISQCSGNGLWLDGASDAKFTQVISITNNNGIVVGGGSNQFTMCKGSYNTIDGWVVSSSRAHLTGCHGQDNGRWGYNVTGATPTFTSCVADSNQRLNAANGGGFYLNAAGMYDGLDAYDRAQTPGSPQLRGVVMGPSIGASYVTGKASVPSGTGHVSGTAPQYARIVRAGSTLYAVG